MDHNAGRNDRKRAIIAGCLEVRAGCLEVRARFLEVSCAGCLEGIINFETKILGGFLVLPTKTNFTILHLYPKYEVWAKEFFVVGWIPLNEWQC